MISNKDLRVEGGNLIINGEKHPLDPAVNALTKRANIVQGKFSALDAKLDAIEALEKTASGNPISLTGAAAAYAISNIMTIEPVQSGSGDPSPTNVRPISGISKAVITRTGKNLVDVLSEFATLYPSYCSLNDGVLSVTTNSELFANGVSVDIPNSENGLYITYEVKALTATNPRIRAFYKDGTNINADFGTTTWSKKTLYVSGKELAKIVFDWSQTGTFEVRNFCVSYIDNNYEPYQGATATITFGQTVYGGSVNFKTGEVTVTHANIASYNGESINEPWLSSIDKYVSGATPTTGAQVVYPLTTPTTLTLTPAELELLKGANTISGNGATINIGYIGR